MAMTVNSTVFWDVVLCSQQKYILMFWEEHADSIFRVEQKPSEQRFTLMMEMEVSEISIFSLTSTWLST
jgi:hypothetical protein